MKFTYCSPLGRKDRIVSPKIKKRTAIGVLKKSTAMVDFIIIGRESFFNAAFSAANGNMVKESVVAKNPVSSENLVAM